MKAIVSLTATKGGWAIADQILSSGTNFAASVAVARLLGPKNFGSYVVAYSAAMVALSIIRSSAVDPYTIVVAPLRTNERRDKTRAASGLVFLAGGVGSVILSIMAIAMGGVDIGQTKKGLLTMAVVLPGLVLQDFWRQACFAAGEPKRAFENDLVWTLVQGCSFFTVWKFFHISTTTIILAWGAGAVASALYGLAQFKVLPEIGSRTIEWMKQIAVVGGWFGVTNVLYSAGNLATSVLISTFCGRSNLGGYQTANNLFSPSNVVVSAGQAVGLPLMSRAYATRGRSKVQRGAKIYSLIMGSILTTYGIIVLSFGPILLLKVFGKGYEEFGQLIVPCAVAFFLNAWASGAAVGLIAMASGRNLFGIQAAILIVQIPLLTFLASRYGVLGAAWAAVAGATLRFILIWTKCSTATGEAREPLNRDLNT